MSSIYNNPQEEYKSWKGTGKYSNPVGITSGNIRPLTNNDPSNNAPQNFGLPRPIQHYRKGIIFKNINNNRQVKSSTGGDNLISQMIDIPGGFSIKPNTTETNTQPCNGIEIISNWQPSTDLTENPEPQTQSLSFCCNQERNALRRVRPSSTKLKKNYYTSTEDYLYNRCQTFEQKQYNYLSSGRPNEKPGSPFSQNNTYKGNCNPNLEIQYANNQLANANNVKNPLTPSNPRGCESVQYKPNNYKFGKQGAVSSSDRIFRLNVETIKTNRANILKSQSNLLKSKYFPNASGNSNESCCVP